MAAHEDPFQLEKLPALALKNCLRFMETKELIDFSLDAPIIKDLLRQIKFEVEDLEWVAGKMRFRASGEPMVHYFKFYEDFNVRFEMNRKTAEHCCYIFRRPLYAVTLALRSFSEDFNWLANRQNSISLVTLELDQMQEEASVNMLRAVNDGRLEITDTLELQFAHQIDRFNYNFEHFHQFRQQLIIYNGNWVTRQNLMQLRCSEITIVQSTITDEDINQLLRNWKNQETTDLDNLKYLMIARLGAINDETILRELNWQELTPEEEDRVLRNQTHYTRNYGTAFKRNDGSYGAVAISVHNPITNLQCVSFKVVEND